jgi:flavin reductase (DIM6/NTAB) family NADH-FMN oxidoreductase RutF
MQYKKISKNKIYCLINTNPLLLISTISKDNKYNIAPIAWVCPQEIMPPRLLFCIDTGHQTFKNIKKTRNFIACIPHISQTDIVKKTGSISGKEVDKFAKFNIKTFIGKKIKCKIPEGVIGYLECKLKKIIKIDTTAIVIADIINAAADKDGFNGERLCPEKNQGNCIYHLGRNIFGTLKK